jgi:branched-chain amino acid aminotransferase
MTASMKAWCNGQIIDSADAAISPVDHGFTVGDGVFETLKVVDGTPFALTRHLARLRRSAAGLGLPEPEAELVREAVSAAVAANAEQLGGDTRMRITYTSGPGPAGSDRGPGPATLTVVPSRGKPWPTATSVVLAPWPRNERSPLTGLKTTSYAENAVALAWAKQRGFSEALLGNLAGQLCEGTGSNVFVVAGGRLLTPPLSSGCLAGITRDLVVEWCGAAEEDLPLDVLRSCEELFITSSTRDVHPVIRVGDRQGDRELEPGPLTREIAREFAARARDLDP